MERLFTCCLQVDEAFSSRHLMGQSHGRHPEIVAGRVDDRNDLASRNLQILSRADDFAFGKFIRDQADRILNRVGVFKTQIVLHLDGVCAGIEDQQASCQSLRLDFEGKLVSLVQDDSLPPGRFLVVLASRLTTVPFRASM